MLPYSDPETLRLLVEQRQADVRRAAGESRSLAAVLGGAARRSVLAISGSRRALRMRASRRPA